MSQVPARTLQPPPCPKHHHPHSCLFHDFLYTSRPNLWVNNREPQCILRAWVPQSLCRGEKPANEKQLFWSFNEQEIKLLLCLSHYLVLDFVVAVIVARVTLYKVDRVYTFTFYLLPLVHCIRSETSSEALTDLTSTGFLHNPTTISRTLKSSKSIYQFKIKARYSPKQSKRTTYAQQLQTWVLEWYHLRFKSQLHHLLAGWSRASSFYASDSSALTWEY